jgi:hypothetical protein
MSSVLLFTRVYGMEIQSPMLVFSTPLVNCCSSTFSVYADSVWLGGGAGGVFSCVVKHSVSEQIQNLHNCNTTPKQLRDWRQCI